MNGAACCAVSVLFAAFICCNSQFAGSGTETTNGISGTVAIKHASGAEGGEIIAAIFSTTYRPDSGTGFAETTVVAADGEFRFDSVAEGRYNLFVWDTLCALGVFRPGVLHDTALGTIELAAAGTIVPEIPLGNNEVLLEVVIPGTPFYAKSGPDRPAHFVNVPEGDYRLQWRDWSKPTSAPPAYIQKNISIDYLESSDTIPVTLP